MFISRDPNEVVKTLFFGEEKVAQYRHKDGALYDVRMYRSGLYLTTGGLRAVPDVDTYFNGKCQETLSKLEGNNGRKKDGRSSEKSRRVKEESLSYTGQRTKLLSKFLKENFPLEAHSGCYIISEIWDKFSDEHPDLYKDQKELRSDIIRNKNRIKNGMV